MMRILPFCWLFFALFGACLTEELKEIENIIASEKTIPGAVIDMLWCGKTNEIVFVLDSEGNVFRSTNYGNTWNNEASRALKQIGRTRDLAHTQIESLVQHPTDPMKIFFLGNEDFSFKTSDGGETYKIAGERHLFHEIKLHPTESNYVLASVLAPDCALDASHPNPGICYLTLYLSKDFGSTWTKGPSYVNDFHWLHSLPASHARRFATHSVIYTMHDKPKRNIDQEVEIWDKGISLYRSDDLFRTQHLILKQANLFMFMDNFIFAATVHDNDYHVKLYMSRDGSHSFHPISLPFALVEYGYTINNYDGTIFLHVDHWGPKAKFGNLYVSNSHGFNYTLSLPHNLANEDGDIDFVKVKGLEGVYFANFLSNVDFDAAYAPELHDHMNPKTAKSNTLNKEGEFNRGKSVMSYDKGASWVLIPAPEKDSKGEVIQCDPSKECGLHLHGDSGIYNSVYSTENALGIMMATGNVGKYLFKAEAKLNTYLSRDAGLSWVEVAKGSHIFEFGDHGGVLVMAPDNIPTNSILYSWDEGKSFKSYKFTEAAFIVNNIIIEPGATSTKFILYGSRDDNNEGSYGVLVYLDFNGVFQRNCAGVDTPDTEGSDYEKWIPWNGAKGDKCMLGREITYVRRKQDVKCFNTETLQRETFVKHCECTELDWECDFSHTRDVGETICKKIFDVDEKSYTEQQCAIHNYYYIINGYQKVAGNSCAGGVTHASTLFNCPGRSMFSGRLGMPSLSLYQFIGLFSAFALCVMMYFRGKSSSNQKLPTSKSKYAQSFTGGGPSRYAPSSGWNLQRAVFSVVDGGMSVIEWGKDVFTNGTASWRYKYHAPGDRIPDSALDFNDCYDDVDGLLDGLDDADADFEPTILSSGDDLTANAQVRNRGGSKQTLSNSLDEDFNPRGQTDGGDTL